MKARYQRTSTGARAIRRIRRGSVAPILIAAMPALIAAMVLATQLASLRHRSLELQIATDAAADAGITCLVPKGILPATGMDGDPLLFGADPIPPSTKTVLFQMLRDVAFDYGTRNQYQTQGLVLDQNSSNAISGEMVIGTIQNPFDTTLDNDLTPTWDLYNPRFNVFQVACMRGGPILSPFLTGDVSAYVRTYLDRDVTGFKVQGTSTVVGPSGSLPSIPVVPIAIRSDYVTNPPTDSDSWDYRIIHRLLPTDNYSIATGTPVFGPAPQDGIPELTVTITGGAGANGQVVDVGTLGVTTDAANQVTQGITYQQLANPPFFGELTLATSPFANENTLTRYPVLNAADITLLAANLTALISPSEHRVWMLYDTVDAPAPGNIHVVGFVAARIMNVTTDGSTFVRVILQPTTMNTCNATTDFTRRNLGPRQVFGVNSIFNPYVCRVRIAQ